MKSSRFFILLITFLVISVQPIIAQKKDLPKKEHPSHRDSLSREDFFKMKLSLTAAEYTPFVNALQTHQKTMTALKQELKEKKSKQKNCTDKEEFKRLLRDIQGAQNKMNESKLQFQTECVDIIGIERAKQLPSLQRLYQKEHGKKKGKKDHQKKEHHSDHPKK